MERVISIPVSSLQVVPGKGKVGKRVRKLLPSTRDVDGSEEPNVSRHDIQIRTHFLLREFLTNSEADAGNFTKRINTNPQEEDRTLPFSSLHGPYRGPDSILKKSTCVQRTQKLS